jgi:hypothetical protein
MTTQNKNEPKNQLAKTQANLAAGDSITIASRLEVMESLPHRKAVLHWGTLIVSLLSLILLSTWVFSDRAAVSGSLIWLDIGLSVVLAIEFFTRSGLRLDPAKYLRTRLFGIFDLLAIIPALALVHHGLLGEAVWVWVILAVRFVRVIDRFLGDGFVQRNALALLEGIEEEITDMVLERIIVRIQTSLGRTSFSKGIAEAFVRNKPSVLQRVRAATPHEGLVPGLAHIVGLDAALERAEESTYDSVVQIMNSEEVDRAVRDVISTSFGRMRNELGKKEWRQHLGIRSRVLNEKTANPPGPRQEA